MPGERVDIGHQLGLARGRSGAANAFANGNPHAGWFALKGANYQLSAVIKIKARPVQIGHAVKDERREIGRLGNAVWLIGKQRARLVDQFGIQFRLRQCC